MKKKGFTLTEMLAVVLIICFLVLVAVPAITKLLKQIKEEAFITNSKTIIRAMTEDCESFRISKEVPTVSFFIENGKIVNDIKVNGTMPNDGYVLLDDSCNVKSYYLDYVDYIYANEEDGRKDYMLKAPTTTQSIFKDMYPSYYDNIKSITFLNHLNISESAIEIKDPTTSGNNKVKSWLVPDGEKYNLYIGSEGKIYANYNSSYLFEQTKATSIDIDNLFTNFTTNMEYMLSYADNLTSFDASKLVLDNVTNINSMFRHCISLSEINVLNWNTKSIISMIDVFNDCINVNELNVSKWNTSNVTSMYHLFDNCFKIKRLDISNWNTSNVTNMSYLFGSDNTKAMALTQIKGIENIDISNVTTMNGIFSECINLKSLDLSRWDPVKLNNMNNMFYNNKSLVDLKIGNWKLNKIINLENTFKNCSSLTELKLTNWDFTNVTNLEGILDNTTSLQTLILPTVQSANLLKDYLPIKTADAPGTLKIMGDKTGLDASLFTSKYWNIG